MPSLPITPILNHHRCSAWTWFTYPHCNGFLADGRSLVLGRFDGADTVLVQLTLASGHEQELTRLPGIAGRQIARWYDISLQSNRLITVVDNRVLAIDLGGDVRPREVYRAAADTVIHELPTISADGLRVLIPETGKNGVTTVSELTLDSGRLELLFSHNWYCNHFHFCPADEAWIGYSHEGATEGIPDRMWGWHHQLAPLGRCIFDQASEVPGIPLCVGHERWMFHRPGAVVVAYGASPHGPRGLWEISVDGSPPQLLSAGQRDLHLNIDRAGTRIVFDTSGSLDCPGRGWENNDERSDVLLLDLVTRERSWLARTDASGLQFPAHMRHPFHPHPHFSPDGRSVVFNDYAKGLPSVSVIHF